MSGAPETREPYTMGYGPIVVGSYGERTAAQEAGFLLPHLKPGMRVLDCGCGPGAITLGLAAHVAPGVAVGIDVERSQVAAARALAARERVDNVSFDEGTVYALPYPTASFDAVFACALFGNVSDHGRALSEMKRVLRPGGLIAIREFDHGATVTWPPHPMLELELALYQRLRASNGHDGSSGRRMRQELGRAGFVDVEARAIADSAGAPEEVAAWAESSAAVFHEAFRGIYIERGWADIATCDAIEAAWGAFAQSADAFMTTLWVEALGRAPSP
jgi:SAM-dependent methyltransferase